MKKILCFGDSITWGFNIETFGRFAEDVRWTGILQHKLGSDYKVIEQGLNGRTTVYEDEFTPFGAFGVGKKALPMILNSQSPIDLVILMLGTNDLQPHRNTTVANAARGCAECIGVINQSMAGPDGKAPKILLVSPPPIGTPGELMQVAFAANTANAEDLSHYYSLVANTFGVDFLDAASFLTPCEQDGIHLDAAGNRLLADKVYDKVKEIL